MKKFHVYRLIAMLLAALLCFVSCTADGDVTETAETAGTPAQADGSISVGEVDLSAFSDTVSDAKKIELTHMYTFQPLPRLEENWSYDSLQINTYDGMLCLTVRRKDERRIIVERQVAVLDPDDGIVKRIPYTVPKVDYYDDNTLLEGITGMHMLDENTFLHTPCRRICICPCPSPWNPHCRQTPI